MFTAPQNVPSTAADEDSEEEQEEQENNITLLQKRREECERKARRGEMDPRLEFTFQLLIDATGLPRSEIMDNVFEGNMDLFCGVINAVHVGLVTTVQRVMEFVFMEALAQPSTESEEEEVGGAIVRDQLLPGLRSFCSALKVCEDVCKEPNIFDDGKNYMESIVTFDDAKSFLSPENIAMLEERLKLWLRRIHEVIMESEQLRKENDTSGPQDELEYWKKRDAQFSQIVSQIQAHEITNQMIKNCKQYITCHGKETIWSQDRAVTREKLVHCVKLNKAYHDSYIYVKEHNYVPDQPPLQFSENYVFGKFDTFCRRLTKIISMFNLVDDYNSLFECRMEELEDVIKQFNEIKNGITSKTYDYLDHRNQDFDNDFEQLIANTNMLKERIANTIEENYAGIWETLQGDMLDRFLKTVRRVKLEVRPLFLPQLVRLTALLNPALRDLTWTDPEWRNFIGKTNEAVDSFDILIT
ncbi:unnamed protein product, partial [Nesidiocoris tenuis]